LPVLGTKETRYASDPMPAFRGGADQGFMRLTIGVANGGSTTQLAQFVACDTR
jgi:hypothetical protein